MKKFILLFVVALMSFSASTLAEQPNSNATISAPLHKDKEVVRPRTQTPDYIECCYDQGTLYFNSDVEFVNVTIDIINYENNECIKYNLLSSDCALNIDLEQGIYRIVFVSNYATYEGDLIIL